MANRKPVSITQNRWHDAQTVDQQDMDVEQDHNAQKNAAIVNNHFGSGVLPSSLTQNVIFDTDNLTSGQAALLSSGDFDGSGLTPHSQPTDTNLGNQLEVKLTGTNAFGRLSTKVLIIGVDFEGNTQFERFIFHKDETQVGKKHHARVLSVFFSDFKGNNNCSRNLGGQIVIREAKSFQISRDPIMVAQDLEPNLFFRDFHVPDPLISLFDTIQSGIGTEFSVDSLGINTTVKSNRFLSSGDVSSKIGQKFQAKTNNIQKISLLLGVSKDTSTSVAKQFDWSGDLVISIFELQTTVSCPTDIVPELAIEFDPKSEPVAQLSFSQAELEDLGYVLNDVLQPIDFVFSDTQLGSTLNSVIVPDRFYAITISRSGDASNGELFTGTGNNVLEDSRLTLFNTNWVDVVEEDLWFQVWTDAAKVTDGKAYDEGEGIQINKTFENDEGATENFSFGSLSFVNSGENVLNNAVIQAIEEESVTEQDERTGNTIFSRKKFMPSFSFLENSDLNDLKETSEPLIIGCAQDSNPKKNPSLEKIQDLPGLVKGDTFIVVDPDPDLESLRLIGSKLVPNKDNANKTYKIFKVLSCTDGYGDINGDGYIDSDDIAEATALLGESLNLNSTQQKIHDGYIDTLELLRADVDGDGYITSNDVDLITKFVNRETNSFPIGSTFQHLEIIVQQATGRFDGYFDCDGYVKLDQSGANVVSSSSLSEEELKFVGFISDVNMEVEDPSFTTVPFTNKTFQVISQSFWQDYLLGVSGDTRLVPASFVFSDEVEKASCEPAKLFDCTNRSKIEPDCSSGRNDIMVPDNLIINNGEILRPDGSFYKVDYEIGHVILQLPQVPLDESVIDVFNKFVVDAGDGFTSAGFNAMRFADCTTVKSDALAKNQVRFGVSVQAFVPNLDGYTDEDGYGVIVDDIIGVHLDHSNGVLKLTIKDLFVDPQFMTLVTKIQISVHLKKSGWNNQVLVIEPDQVPGLLSN